MIIGIGIDIVETHRIKDSIEKYGERFLSKVFTATEREYCDARQAARFLHYSARFAAKEAFCKAIGTGISNGFSLNLFGIKNLPSGKPTAELFALMHERWSTYRIHVTLSHTATNACAVVVIEE